MAFPNVGSTQQSSSLFGAPKPPGGSIFGAPQQTQQQPAGLFGQPAQQQQQQQQPTTSIFGQPAQQQQQQPGTSIFGQPAQQQPATSLFGQTAQQQPTGLFGQSTQQPQQQPTGGLFGQPAGQQQQPTGGLFGQPAGQQQQPAGGLFGQPTTQPTGGLFGQSTSQPAGGLFGQPSQQPRQQSTFGGGSLFGTSGQQPQGSMFGSLGTTTQQQPQQQQGSLFGTSLQPQATIPAGGFGGGGLGTTSLFGGQQQQQLSTFGPSAMPSNVPLLSKSTKFNDLPDDLKRTLEGIESHIQGRIQISKDLQQRKLGDEPTKGQELIRGIHKELVNTSTLTRDDLHFTKDMKAKVEQAVQDTIVATRIVDGFKNPQGAAYLKDHAGFPLEFFTRVTDNMKQRLAWYKSTIEQIERKLSSSATQTQTPQGISATLQAQHATFLALANKTAALDAELQKIKTMYTQLWRAKTGSVRDPFNDLDRTSGGDLGMGRLDVK